MLAILLVSTEFFSRLYLGLGDPPLSMSDPDIGYLFKPNQICHRFGNLVHYNAYSMRSDDFPAHKSHPNEFRVMVLGNSVINGGALTDQSQVCTSILQKELAAKLNRPVVVGNISAGGWGVLSMWHYVRKLGLFDADVLVIVTHSGCSSMPFPEHPVAGADPSFPDHKPWCATAEAVTRYLPRYLPSLGQVGSNEGFHEGVADPKVTAQCMDALQSMIAAARQSGAKSYVVLHWTRTEVEKATKANGWRPIEFKRIQAASEAAGATVLGLEPPLPKPTDYRDDIHVNQNGQAHLASLLVGVIQP